MSNTHATNLAKVHPDTTVCGQSALYPNKCGCGADLEDLRILPSRFDTIATVIVRMADGTELVNLPILLEDVTTTNGAYRCVRDEAAEEVATVIRGMLHAHRAGETLTGESVALAANYLPAPKVFFGHTDDCFKAGCNH